MLGISTVLGVGGVEGVTRKWGSGEAVSPGAGYAEHEADSAQHGLIAGRLRAVVLPAGLKLASLVLLADLCINHDRFTILIEL